MSFNFRTIAKIGFLLVVIGFCLPMACDSNGFEIASDGFVDTWVSILLYGLFVTAIIGFIAGLLLFVNKGFPVTVDWVVSILCIACGLVPFFYFMNDFQYQTGVYIVLAGYAVIIVCQILSYIKKET